jgi:ABC-type Mn2+/Zn2+ transport system ATPase subunit
LEHAAEKQIRYFSSGMKQRLKLAQCIFSDVPFVLLDEPCTNLDTRGIDLYHQLIENYTTNRCVIVSSNDTTEYGFCKEVINLNLASLITCVVALIFSNTIFFMSVKNNFISFIYIGVIFFITYIFSDTVLTNIIKIH